jgi:hypothetical protein
MCVLRTAIRRRSGSASRSKGPPLVNPFGALGTAPAFSPSLMFNLRARYDWAAGLQAVCLVGANHIGSENNEPASFTPGNTQYDSDHDLAALQHPGYTTYDGAIGVAKDNWIAHGLGQQLDELGCSHEHLVGAVHQVGSAAAAARADAAIGVQVLIG